MGDVDRAIYALCPAVDEPGSLTSGGKAGTAGWEPRYSSGSTSARRARTSLVRKGPLTPHSQPGSHRGRLSRRSGAVLLAAGFLGAALLLPGAMPVLAAVDSAAGDGRQAPRFAGRELASVLADLQRQGLVVVFTSALVRPGMFVELEPRGTPRQMLDQVLGPHELRAAEGPDGVLVVVPAPRRPALATSAGAGDDELPVVRAEIEVRADERVLGDASGRAAGQFDGDELARLAHGRGDALRAFTLLPGVSGNDVTSRPTVRGSRADQVSVVLDGQELYAAFHMQDFGDGLTIVPSQGVAEATLSSVAVPASRGDRLGGMLELRTHRPAARGQRVLALSTYDALASAGAPVAAERGAWLVTARRGEPRVRGDLLDEHDPRFWDAFAKGDGEAGRAGSFAGHLLYAVDDLRVDRNRDNFAHLGNRYESRYGWIDHQATVGRRLLVETAGSWSGMRRARGTTIAAGDGGHVLADRREVETGTLSQAFTLQLSSTHLLRWGWEAKSYQADFDYTFRRNPDLVLISPFASPQPASRRFVGELSGEHQGIWASDRLTRGALTAEAGVRFDRHPATGDQLVSPRLAATMAVGRRGLARAAWSALAQSQRPYELQVEDGETRLARAERSRQWLLEYQTSFAANRSGISGAGLGVFRTDVVSPRPRFENVLRPLPLFPELQVDRVRLAPRRSLTHGVELSTRGEAGARFDWWLAYTWQRAEDRLAGRWRPRSGDQRHNFVLDLDWRPASRWNVNLAWRYHSGWPTTLVTEAIATPPDSTPPEEPTEPGDPGDEGDDEPTPEDPTPEDPTQPPSGPLGIVVLGDLYGARLEAYHRLDLRVSRSFRPRLGDLEIYLDVQNVYDRHNLAGSDVAFDRELGLLELEPIRWPGLQHSFGVVWRF